MSIRPLGDLGELRVMNGPSHAKNAKGAKDCIEENKGLRDSVFAGPLGDLGAKNCDEENRRTPVASHSGLRRECYALFYEGAQARVFTKKRTAPIARDVPNLERRPTPERRRPSRRHGRTPPAQLAAALNRRKPSARHQ
jgi:hypothetical protein